MAKANHRQLAFNAGVLAPHMSGRIDQDKYSSGCETLENFFPIVEGPAQKRSGTKFIKEVGDSSQNVALVPFTFSTVASYVLEFGHQYMRVYRDGGIVLDSTGFNFANPPTATNPVVIETSGAHGWAFGDEVLMLNTSMVEINDRYFSINVTGATTFELVGEDGTGRSSPTSVGSVSRVFEQTINAFTSAIVPYLKTAQSADVLYLVSSLGNLNPRSITRVADDNWTVTNLTFAAIEVAGVDDVAPPWRPLNITNTTMYANGLDPVTITASVATFDLGMAGTGQFLRIQDTSSSWGYMSIDTFTDSTHVSGAVYKAFPAAVQGAGNATRDWSFNAFNGDNGFPRALTFHFGRLWFAGTSANPQTLWASATNFYENFNLDSSGGPDDPGILFTIAQGKLDAIEWLAGGSPLVAGSRSGEFTIEGELPNTEINAGAIVVQRRSSHGSKIGVTPVEIGSVILFVQRAGKQVREFVFQFETDQYVAPNMNRLARHLTDAGIAKLVFQQSPSRILWAILEDDTLLSFTYEREESVAAWSRHIIGGTAVAIKSAAVIPTTDGTSDELWLVVSRTINGATRQYVEILQPDWEAGGDTEDAWFLDAALKYDDVSTSTITLLHHLEAETVKVFADGLLQTDKTVDSDGQITLDTAASVVLVGLPYTARLKTMDLEAGGQRGVSQGRIKRLVDCILRLYQTGEGLEYGQDFDTMDTLDLRDLDDLSSDPVDPYDGDTRRLEMPGGVTREARLALRHALPYPCTVVAAFTTIETQDGG
jgi:hypothetical protein